jgi:hypothetical protein
MEFTQHQQDDQLGPTSTDSAGNGSAVSSDNSICGYRGFKLFIPGEHMVQFLLTNGKAFNLQGEYSVYDDHKYELPLKGYWGEEYKVGVTATQIKNLGIGVEIRGDFQRLFSNGNDEQNFTWVGFIESMQSLLSIMRVKDQPVHIINLAVGLDLPIREEWNTSAFVIVGNILQLEKVIERVCPVSFKKELQNLITQSLEKLSKQAVPDFPLYVEKRGEVFIPLTIAPTTLPFNIYLASLTS